MNGGRLLLLGGPERDPHALAAALAGPDRRTAVLPPETVRQGPPDALPDVLVVSLYDPKAHPELEPALHALAGSAVHAVFLAPADLPLPPRPPEPLLVLHGLDAQALAVILDTLAERDAATKAAAVANAWKEAFHNAFPGYIVACDAENHVAYANEAIARRAGRDPVGQPCYAILHGRNAPCPWCPAKAAQEGETVAMEFQSPLDGRFFASSSTMLRLPDREPLLLTLFYDVTDRNMAHARLRALNRDLERRVDERTEALGRQTADLAKANARLREIDSLKSAFLATVTHDLRTPLTSVLGFAKLTRRDFIKDFMPFSDVSDHLRRKGKRIAENLGIIEAEGARLTRLVNDFLDLSKIESGRLDWHDQIVDASDVARAAIDAVGGEYEQNQAMALVVDIPPQLPPVRLDPDRLMQVLVNLLTNAVRHTGEGEVTLAARPLGSRWLELRVSDTGPGIPQEERERIFEKFHQVSRGDTTDADRRGTGLGLAICKQIVERYGGSIRAEGREPHGTAFVVELPVWAEAPGPAASRPTVARAPNRAAS